MDTHSAGDDDDVEHSDGDNDDITHSAGEDDDVEQSNGDDDDVEHSDDDVEHSDGRHDKCLNVEKCPTKWRLLSSLRQAECQVLKHAEGLQPRDNCATFTSFDN